MRGILLTLIVFGSIPIILIKPHFGVLMWAWLSYMNPHRLTWGFAYDFSFALVMAVATMFAWLVSSEPKRLPWNMVVALLLVFSIWVSFTTLFALYPDAARQKWELTIKILFFNGFLTLALMRSRERLNALIWVIVVSIGFYGIKGGIFTLLTGGHYQVSGPAGSFFGDNNALALALLMIIPLMRYLQLTTRKWWIRWGLVAAMLLSVISIIGSQSRGGFIGLVILLTALLLKTRKKLLIGGAIGLIFVAGVSFMPERWHARMETILTFQEDTSMQGRFRAWNYAIEIAATHPIVGGGFMAFLGNKDPTTGGKYRSAHSIYFEVLGEHGFVGLALYLMLGIATFLTGTSIIRRTRGDPDLIWARDLARMTQVSLVAFAAAGAALNLAFFDLYYHLVVILALTSVLVREALIDSETAEPVSQDSVLAEDGQEHARLQPNQRPEKAGTHPSTSSGTTRHHS